MHEQSKTKRRAREAVARAVSSGALVRPTSCEDCGGEGPIFGHHVDYARPLDVEWLCLSCHWDRHRGDRVGKRTGPRGPRRRREPDPALVENLLARERAYVELLADVKRERDTRNAVVAQALAEGMTHAKVAEALGKSRGRVGQLAMEAKR